MAITISSAIRARVLELLKQGMSARAISREIGISVPSAIRFRRDFLKTGVITTKEWRHNPNARRPNLENTQLGPHVDFVIDYVQTHPNASLKAVALAVEEKYGVKVHRETVRRFLNEVGYHFS